MVHRYHNTIYNVSFYKTKYKLYTTSLNILKCCNTFKTFHIQLAIIQLVRDRTVASLQLNNLCIPARHLAHMQSLYNLPTIISRR